MTIEVIGPSVDSQDLNDNFDNLVNSINEITNTNQSQTANLVNGLQTITTDQATPAWMVKIIGRTLVNPLGKDGNCEDTSKFGSGLTLDTSNYLYGSASLQASSGGRITPNYYPSIDDTKYYIVLSNIITKDSSYNAFVRVVGGQSGSVITQGTLYSGVNWGLSYCLLSPTDSSGQTTLRLDVVALGTPTGYTWNADGIRIFELTQQMYNDIQNGVYTTDEIGVLFPFVNSVQHVLRPVVKGYGKNLLPPLSEWVQGNTPTITGSYSANINTGDSLTIKNIPVIAGETYTGSIGSTTLDRNMLVHFFNASGIQTGGDYWATVTGGGYNNIISPSDAISANIELYTVSTNGSFTNPQLELGSTATPFEPQDIQYLYGVSDDKGNPLKLASSVDGTINDEFYQVDSTNFRVVKRFEKDVALDGSLSWAFGADLTGYKYAKISPLNNYDNHNHYHVKFDGTIMQYGDPHNSADLYYYDGNYQYISIADTDSGWGETYTPTASEIQAYFYGYKLNNGTFGTNYNGTGTKTWIPWGDTDNSRAVTSVPTSESPSITDGTYDYYRLTYQLAQSEDIAVEAYGSVSLIDGENQISLSEGIEVQEKVVPYLSGSTYYINSTNSSAYLQNRASQIIGVYKDGQLDNTWTVNTDGTSNGIAYATNSDSNVNTSKYEYTVTYELTDKYKFTSSVGSASFDYSTNLSTVVNQNTQSISDNSREITIHTNQLIDILIRMKAAGI